MQSCIRVCLAVSSAFCRNFVDEDLEALEPDVIMLIVVVRIIAMRHGLRRPAFFNTGRSRCFVGVKVRCCLFW